MMGSKNKKFNLVVRLIQFIRTMINIKSMENTKTESCQKNDLFLQVKTSRRPRFKAGAELSGKVNRMNVEVNEVICEEAEDLEIRIHLTSEVCTIAEQ